MFDRNSPARPTSGLYTDQVRGGLTKFEQCAKEFTAAALPYFLQQYNAVEEGGNLAEKRAAQVGILTAEEFCAAMEERGKDAKP
jgi:hypothetical protein